MIELNDDTFELFAMKHYRNENCFDISEFYEDIKRIRYIRILINRYKDTGNLQERLILNHFIAMGNVFSIDGLVKLILHKVDEDDYQYIKPFLSYLNFMPKIVYGVKGRNIWDSEIRSDEHITKKLNEL